jgi:hypothetical protein
MIPLKPWQKRTLSVLGILIGGALGSGLWQRLGDPLYLYLRNAILNSATFLFKGYKNLVYESVAVGFHEHSSAAVDGFLVICLAMLCAGLTGYFVSFIRPPRVIPTKPKPPVWLSWGMASVFFLGGIVFIIVYTKTTYVPEAIGYYEQLKRIDGPFLTPEQLKQLDSEFAQIQSREDYDRVIEQLTSIASAHNFKQPRFEVW